MHLFKIANTQGKNQHKKKGRDFKVHGQHLKLLALLEKRIDSLVFQKAKKCVSFRIKILQEIPVVSLVQQPKGPERQKMS